MGIEQILGPIRQRIGNMIARAVLRAVDDAKGLQFVQVEAGALGEVRGPLERFQNYGFTSVPRVGAESIVLFLGGSRDHGIVLAVDDRRYRLKGLASGAVALYTADDNKIVLNPDGNIQVIASEMVSVEAPTVEVEAENVTVTGTSGVTLTGGGTVKGVVQGDCVCAFTGSPHPQTSIKIKGSL